MTALTLSQPRHQAQDYESFMRSAFELEWSDGLPLVPPTPRKVAEFLNVVGLAPDTVVGTVSSRDIEVTAEVVAANAVMAGCKPEYMPAVLTAVRIHLSPLGNCHCVTATLTGASQLVVLNGPIRQKFGVACQSGALGTGSRANATIGRAVRLVVRNGARSIPGAADRAGFASPARYSFCFGEDEEGSTWTPLHVERGYAADADVVTLAAVTDIFGVHEPDPTDPESFLRRFAHVARCRPILPDTYLGDHRTTIVLVSPEHRTMFLKQGWSKADIRNFLHPLLVAPHTRGEGAVEGQGHHVLGGPTESSHQGLKSPENIVVLSAGGTGLPTTYMLYPHYSPAISSEIPKDFSQPLFTVPA